MSVLLVLCTCPDAATGTALAESLVQARLAACVNRLPGVLSVYRWQDRIEHAEETLLLIKSTSERFDELCAHIRQRHPYGTPEVLGVPASAGLPEYLGWVEAETTPGGAAP